MMEKLNLRASYDDIADVLYLTSGNVACSKNREDEAGLVVRYDIDTSLPIGATVLDYKEFWLPQKTHLIESLSKSLRIAPNYLKTVMKSAF